MALKNKEALKARFKQGGKPTETDFADLIDSCYGISDIQLELEGNNLVYTQLNDTQGVVEQKYLNLGQFDQSLEYDAVTNQISITGSNKAPVPLGYWGAGPGSRLAAPKIATDAKVGIKTNDPQADLHVNGQLKLQFGVNANAISNSFSDNFYKHLTIPTVAAIKAYYDHKIEKLQRDLAILANSSQQRFLEVAIKTPYTLPTEETYILLETVNHIFDPAYYFNLADFGTYGSMFMIPMDGRYSIETNLHPHSGNGTTSFDVILEINGQPRDVVASVVNGSIVSVPAHTMVIDANRGNSVRLVVDRKVAGSVVSFQTNTENSLTITKAIL